MANDILVKVGADISGFSRAMSNVTSEMGKMGSQLGDMGKRVSGVGDTLTRNITTPALAAASALTGITLVKGFQRLIGIDTARAKLSALGHDAENVEEIMNNALDSVRGTSFGMDEAATAAASAVAAGIQPGKELTKYLNTMGDAAAIAGADFNEMASIFNKVETAQRAYTGDLNMLADRGIPIYQWLADEAGTSAEAIRDMASSGEVSAEMFRSAIEKNIGGAAKEIGEKSFAAALKNIGADIGRIGANFLDAGGEAGGFFSTVKPLLTEFREFLQSFEGQAAELGVKFGEAFNNVVERIREVKDWFDNLSPSMQGLVTKIMLFAPAALVGLGPILKIVGGLMTSFGGLTKTASKVVKHFHSFSTIGAALKAAFMANPVGILIAALAGLIVVITLVVKNFDKIKQKILETFPAMEPVFDLFSQAFERAKDGIARAVEALKTAWEGLKPIITVLAQIIGGVLVAALGIAIGLFNGLMNAVGPVISMFANFISFITNFVAAFVKLFTGDFAGAFEHWQNAGTAAIQVFVDAFEAVITFVAGLVETIVEFFHGLYMTLVGNSIIPDMVNAIVEWFTNLWDWLVGIVSGIVDAIVSRFTEIYETVTKYVEMARDIIVAVWEYIKETFVNVLSFLVSLVTGDFQGMKDAADKQMKNIRNLLSNIWQIIKNNTSQKLQEMLSDLISKFSDMVSNVRNKATEIVNTAREKFEEVKQKIREKLTEAVTVVGEKIGEMPGKVIEFVSDMISAGGDLVQGLIDGIKDMSASAIEAITGVVGGVIEKAKNLLKISSPSRLFKQYGQWTGEGLADGITQSIRTVERASERMIDAMMPERKEIDLSYATPSGIKASLSSAVRGTVDVNSREELIADAIEGLRRDMASLRVEVNEREFGRLVSDSAAKERSESIRGGGRRRI